jgi:DNA-binding NarL/FixJ family response regulator
MTEPIRVAVADDHPLFRDGVIMTLKSVPELDVVGAAASADEAVEVAQQVLPDVMLMDIHMSGCGIEATRQISNACPVVKIIMLTVSEDVDDLTSALEAGARGYILKGVSGPDLVSAVVAVHNGESYVTPALAARVLSRMRQAASGGGNGPCDRLADLTFREEQVLVQLASGATNLEIGKKLNLSEKTVKHYVTNILQKMQVRNRVEAALSFKRIQEAREKGAKRV